jgi:hypothetical protein
MREYGVICSWGLLRETFKYIYFL